MSFQMIFVALKCKTLGNRHLQRAYYLKKF